MAAALLSIESDGSNVQKMDKQIDECYIYRVSCSGLRKPFIAWKRLTFLARRFCKPLSRQQLSCQSLPAKSTIQTDVKSGSLLVHLLRSIFARSGVSTTCYYDNAGIRKLTSVQAASSSAKLGPRLTQ